MLSPAAYLNPNHNLTVTLLLKPQIQPQTCLQKLFDGRLVPTSIVTVEFLVLTGMYKCAHRHTGAVALISINSLLITVIHLSVWALLSVVFGFTLSLQQSLD